MNQAAQNQRPVIPQVRYHPSIQMAGSGTTAGATCRPQTRTRPKMLPKNQNSNRTGPAGAHRPPDNDADPTADQASSKPDQRSRPGAARHPQTRTEPRVVQKNQDSNRTGPAGAYRPPDTNPDPTADQASSKPDQRSRPGAARHPQTRTEPRVVQKNQNSNRTGPAGAHRPPDTNPDPTADQASSKPDQRSRPGAACHPQTRTEPRVVQKNQDSSRTGPCLNGGPEPKRDLGSADNKAPPTPDQVPLRLRAKLDRNLLQEVEFLTRGQSTNQDWFHWRKNRITASVAHRIAHSRFINGKSKAPPTSYLAAITGEGPKVRTRAMSWGIEKEAEVVRKYQTLKSEALGRPVRVLECGLFIDGQRPWLAASPDGIVVDARSGRRLLCLEVKCPYKHRHRSVEDACRDDPAFCLQLLNGDTPGQAPVYALKRSHSYFTQIQVQLAVTGLDRADLVVFTLKETAIVPVTFDPDLWDETVSKLEVFYRDAVLPHLRQKMEKNADAGPEL